MSDGGTETHAWQETQEEKTAPAAEETEEHPQEQAILSVMGRGLGALFRASPRQGGLPFWLEHAGYRFGRCSGVVRRARDYEMLVLRAVCLGGAVAWVSTGVVLLVLLAVGMTPEFGAPPSGYAGILGGAGWAVLASGAAVMLPALKVVRRSRPLSLAEILLFSGVTLAVALLLPRGWLRLLAWYCMQ